VAYTHNVDYSTGLIEKKNDPSSTVKITFSTKYYSLQRLDTAIANGKARSIKNDDKWDLDRYVNKGK